MTVWWTLAFGMEDAAQYLPLKERLLRNAEVCMTNSCLRLIRPTGMVQGNA